MVHKIPKCESLKCTLSRSKIYWEKSIIPSIQQNKKILIVGHENNLRSLIMNLENIHPKDIINLCLPRGIPLMYCIDSKTCQPINMRSDDGKLDDATGMLRGEWLYSGNGDNGGSDEAVKDILERDRKQVYDVSIEENLEIGNDDEKEKWKKWTELVIGSSQHDHDDDNDINKRLK
jgi:hypothetical protein